MGEGPISVQVVPLGGGPVSRTPVRALKSWAWRASCCSRIRIAFMRMCGSVGLLGSMPRNRMMYSVRSFRYVSSSISILTLPCKTGMSGSFSSVAS